MRYDNIRLVPIPPKLEKRVVAYCDKHQVNIGGFVEMALHSYLDRLTIRKDLAKILDEVAVEHGIPKLWIMADDRSPKVAAARLAYYHRAITETDRTATQIGAFIGRDRKTASDGAKSYARRLGLPNPTQPLIYSKKQVAA